MVCDVPRNLHFIYKLNTFFIRHFQTGQLRVHVQLLLFFPTHLQQKAGCRRKITIVKISLLNHIAASCHRAVPQHPRMVRHRLRDKISADFYQILRRRHRQPCGCPAVFIRLIGIALYPAVSSHFQMTAVDFYDSIHLNQISANT